MSTRIAPFTDTHTHGMMYKLSFVDHDFDTIFSHARLEHFWVFDSVAMPAAWSVAV